jgi:oxygen-independent coproporphyrinogen-3 oxidase
MRTYVENLITQLRSASRNAELAEIETIYIGGGTPSHLGGSLLVSLGYALAASMVITKDTEFTIEANPESLTPAIVRDLYALGVNRCSIGVQSLNDNELQLLGRKHDGKKAVSAINHAKIRFENISVDLICGLPEQTTRDWLNTLSTVIALGVAHISVYPLSLESHTPLAKKIKAGELAHLDDDLQATLMEVAADYLQAAGYERYEIASYAKPGYRCRHNIAYWTGKAYLGLGDGACGMINLPDGRVRLRNGQVVEKLTLTQRLAEDLMLNMRMSDGVAMATVMESEKLLLNCSQVFKTLENDGLIFLQDEKYRPTKRGWLLGNQIFSRIWELAE